MSTPDTQPVVLSPPPDEVVVLEPIAEPYRPPRPFHLANKPQMIDPMVNPLQLCMVDQGQVIGQCNAPADENDYHAWQRVIGFCRSLVAMVKPVRPQLLFMIKGEVLGDPCNVPTIEGDLNVWQSAMIQLRVHRAILRIEGM